MPDLPDKAHTLAEPARPNQPPTPARQPGLGLSFATGLTAPTRGDTLAALTGGLSGVELRQHVLGQIPGQISITAYGYPSGVERGRPGAEFDLVVSRTLSNGQPLTEMRTIDPRGMALMFDNMGLDVGANGKEIAESNRRWANTLDAMGTKMIERELCAGRGVLYEFARRGFVPNSLESWEHLQGHVSALADEMKLDRSKGTPLHEFLDCSYPDGLALRTLAESNHGLALLEHANCFGMELDLNDPDARAAFTREIEPTPLVIAPWRMPDPKLEPAREAFGQELARLGITLPEGVRLTADQWQAIVPGRTPEEFRDEMTRGLTFTTPPKLEFTPLFEGKDGGPGGFSFLMKGHAKTIDAKTGHEIQGEIESNCLFNGPRRVMVNDTLALDPTLQGTGLGADISRNNYQMALHMGIKQIYLQANIDVGGYAWFSKGFVPRNESQMEELLSQSVDNLSAKLDKADDLGYSPDQRKALQNASQAFRTISESELTFDEQIVRLREIVNDRSTAFPKPANTIGKLALLGTIWDGVLRLDDQQSRTVYENWLGLPTT